MAHLQQIHAMPYLSKSGLLKVHDSKIYVFISHDLKVQDSPNCPKVLKYDIAIILSTNIKLIHLSFLTCKWLSIYTSNDGRHK
jgi:hypothetical protein